MFKEIVVKLFVAGFMAATMIAGCLTADGCTPQAQQLEAQLGIAVGELACLEVARCNGIVDPGDLAAFCRVAADRVERYVVAIEDASCLVPERDAGQP